MLKDTWTRELHWRHIIHSGPLLSYEFTTLAPKWKHVQGQAMLPHRHGCDRKNRWKMYVADITVAVILCKYSRHSAKNDIRIASTNLKQKRSLLKYCQCSWRGCKEDCISTNSVYEQEPWHKLWYAPLMSKVVFKQEGHAIVTDAIAIYACVAVLGFKDIRSNVFG